MRNETNKIRPSLLGVLFAGSFLFSLVSSFGQPVASTDAPGLKVGDRAPAFKLKDQNGKEHALVDALKQGTVALVFYRSADW